MKTILLTGATGFLGSHLLKELIKKKYKVVILKRSTSDLRRIKHLLKKIKTYDVDKQDIEKAFEDQKINIVIHTAVNYGRNNDSILDVVESNLVYSLKILDCCLKFNVNFFVNTDTFSNTGNLLQKYLNSYNLSKKQFVEWLQQQSNKIKIVNLKLQHMYGPNDNNNKFVEWVGSSIKNNVHELKLTKGKQKRDFIYIDDVVSAYITVISTPHKLAEFSEFDVGTGQLTTVKTFVKKLKKIYENEFYKSKTHLDFGSIPYREHEMMTVKVDNSGLINLGWSVKTTLKKGLLHLVKEKNDY